jgi:two-component system phosphate regulon sensor histidine kinase PhoR
MDAKVQKSLDRLNLYTGKSLEEFKNAITREACSLTESTLAYFATIDATEKVLTMVGWSNSAMMNCSMIDKPIVYQVVDTGLWGDAVRERKAVITNNYKTLVKPTKKGYPSGHVNVVKHMNLPVFENKKIVLVIGVGNKKDDYTPADASLLGEFMTNVYPQLKTKLA